MNPKQLTDSLMVSTQIEADDIARAAEAGVRMIVNNRPDEEEPEQPKSEELHQLADRHGIAYRHIPVTPGEIDEADIAAFDRALCEADGQILAFCRTGTRSATLWALAQAGKRPTDELLDTARNAGYGLDALKPRLDQRTTTIAESDESIPPRADV